MWGALSGLLISCFISINSHVSWDPYKLDPVMFYQFHQGMLSPQLIWNLSGNCQGPWWLPDCQKECRRSCVAPFYTLHFASLDGIYFNLEYPDVEPKTVAVRLFEPHLCTPSTAWTHPCTKPGPLFCLGWTSFTNHTCEGTSPWMACWILILETSCQTPSVGKVLAPHPEIFWCDQI